MIIGIIIRIITWISQRLSSFTRVGYVGNSNDVILDINHPRIQQRNLNIQTCNVLPTAPPVEHKTTSEEITQPPSYAEAMLHSEVIPQVNISVGEL